MGSLKKDSNFGFWTCGNQGVGWYCIGILSCEEKPRRKTLSYNLFATTPENTQAHSINRATTLGKVKVVHIASTH
jgi:hypothetical protein